MSTGERFTPSAHTITGRKHYARLARQHGHLRDNAAGTVSVFCPLCREKVAAPIPRGAGTVTAALDQAMTEHLRELCARLWDNPTIGGPTG